MKLFIITIIVLIIAGTIGLAFVAAKAEAYAQKTMKDVSRIREALKVYFDVNGFYPHSTDGVPADFEQYLSFYPENKNCPYFYERKGNNYNLGYCLTSGQRSIVNGQ